MPSDNQDAKKVGPSSYKVGNGLYRVDWKGDKVTLLDDFSEHTTDTYERGETTTRIEAHWTMLLVGGGISFVCLGLYFCGQAWHAYKKAKNENLLTRAHSVLKSDALLQQRMWEGMNMAIENLQHSVTQLQSVKRELRMEGIIHDIGWKLFGMNMAVDEYIVWLSERDSFPANFSVRSALQPSRYDHIKSVFDKIKASQDLDLMTTG